MSNTALGLTALLLVIPIIISYKEGLHIIKDLIVATLRAVVQLIILGFLLHYIFKINDKWLLVLCVFVIIVNLLGIRLVDHHLSCIMSFGFPLWLSLLERHYRLQVLLRQGPSIYSQ